MPNVKAVACLGEEAWFLTNVVLGHRGESRRFAEHRDSCTPSIGHRAGKRISAFALYHPAARVSDQQKRAPWAAMARAVSS
jgi:uracil-DNA glycosylase